MTEVKSQVLLEQVLEYLEKDYPNCLYLYADVSFYGLENPNLRVWCDQDEEGIRFVVMKYHKSFQVYSNRNFSEVDDLLTLIKQEKPYAISGRKDIICQLEKNVGNNYQATYGVVFKGKRRDLNKLQQALVECPVKVEIAQEKDAPAIAKLLCQNTNEGCAYTEQSLTEELIDRMRTGMGRSFIIRDADQVVAHDSTYAECNRYTIGGGLMVHPAYRNTEYANWVTLKSNLVILQEGKEQYFFANKKRIIRWHTMAGAIPVAEYGKLTMIEKNEENGECRH